MARRAAGQPPYRSLHPGLPIPISMAIAKDQPTFLAAGRGYGIKPQVAAAEAQMKQAEA